MDRIKDNPKLDLNLRTKNLGINIYKLLNNLKYSYSSKIIFEQLLRSGFSVGANYSEATECESRLDFIHKISVSKKEIKEVLYWLDILRGCAFKLNDSLFNTVKKEANELLLIFSKIVKTSKLNAK